MGGGMLTVRFGRGFVLGILLSVPVLAASPKAPSAATKSGPPTAMEVRQAEKRLADLGYWSGPIDGRMDEVFRGALIAFQKIDGRRAPGTLPRRDLIALARAVPPLPRE